MTLDEITAALFQSTHQLRRVETVLYGSARLHNGPQVEVIGIHGGAPLGIEAALTLAGRVIDALEKGGEEPILVLVDGASQRMTKRDEVLGLNEYLAHLGKSLMYAEAQGRRSTALVYGGAAAGAFIVTNLSAGELIAVQGAHPEVMDLPSMAKVTKLELETLERMSKSTAVFAPGIDNLTKVGAVSEVWEPSEDLAKKLVRRFAQPWRERDDRDQLGKQRGGRPKAADIARRVQDAVLAAS